MVSSVFFSFCDRHLFALRSSPQRSPAHLRTNRAKENVRPALPTNLLKVKARKKTFKGTAKSIKAVHLAGRMQMPDRGAGAKPGTPRSKATAAKPTAADDQKDTAKRVAMAAEQRRLARQGFVPGISFKGDVDHGESVRRAREELLMETQREARRAQAERAKAPLNVAAAAWGGARPHSVTGAVPRPPVSARGGSPRLASRPHSAREMSASTPKISQQGSRGFRRPETARAALGSDLPPPSPDGSDGGSPSHRHGHHHHRHHKVVHPAGREQAKKPRSHLQRMLTQGPMQLDLNHHQQSDRTNNAEGQKAIIDAIMRQIMTMRTEASTLRTKREAKTRRLDDLKLRMAEVSAHLTHKSPSFPCVFC